MKKSLLFFLIIFAVFSFYKSVFADTSFTGCDFFMNNPSSGSDASAGCIYATRVGQTGFLDVDRTLYSIDLEVITNPSPSVLYALISEPWIPRTYTNGCQAVSIPTGTGIKNFELSLPVDILAGDAPNFKLFGDSNCSGPDGFVLQLHGPDGGNVNSTWYWSSAIPDNDITPILPADNTTNVDALVSFTGVYTNDGTGGYDAIELSITPDEQGASTTLYRCADVIEGIDVPYSCVFSGKINTTYDYNAQMCDLEQTYPFGCITASTITFTTGSTFQTLPEFGGVSCETFDVGCYVSTSFQWLFMPSQNALDSFNGLYSLFQNKPPFGYVLAIQNALSGINITETQAFSLASMPVLNTYVFSPFRTALVWVLWVAFAFIFFNRLKNIVI